MKRKQRTSLPRLTVLSMSRKELTSFVMSVESLRTQVLVLTEEVSRLRDLVDRVAVKRKRKPSPFVDDLGVPTVNGQGVNDG